MNQASPAHATSFPQKLSLTLSLEFEVTDAEHLSYLVSEEGELQAGFTADLYDMFNFENELGVTSINGITPEAARMPFQRIIP